MLEPFRTEFNDFQFSDEKHRGLVAALNRRTRTQIQFQISETPCFFSRELLDEMAEIGRELTHQLIDDPEYIRRSDSAIPAEFRVQNDNPRPNFMTVDFGLARDADGRLKPKLVELQAFPSIFGYQDVLCEEYTRTYGLSENLHFRFGELSSEAYWSLLGRTILGTHAPENVVLLEIDPVSQKTLPDFNVYEDRLGIRTVDITKVEKQGNRLFYTCDGVTIPIKRIYNRAIVDELQRRAIQPAFNYRDDLDVEWAGHPNWYFRISKFSLPFLKHPSVPVAVFLNDWFAGQRRGLPDDLSQLLLKPLYSFAGKGIQFAPTLADLQAIPESERDQYLLQERIAFEPVIRTPYGMTQAEIRVMYVWPDDAAEMVPVMSLVRMGRGLMMGVDHNRNQQWIGGSAAFFPKRPKSMNPK